jgi:hypothetical protein
MNRREKVQKKNQKKERKKGQEGRGDYRLRGLWTSRERDGRVNKERDMIGVVLVIVRREMDRTQEHGREIRW